MMGREEQRITKESESNKELMVKPCGGAEKDDSVGVEVEGSLDIKMEDRKVESGVGQETKGSFKIEGS